MSVNLSGNQTDYSYTRESGKLVIRENSSGDIAYESPNNFTVTFGDGSTVDLSLSFDNQIASSSSLFFSSPSCTVLTGPSGGYVLVWEQYGLQDDDPGEGLTLMHYDATGKLLKETKLVSGEAEDPCVTAMADGGYIVAWSNESSIVMQKFTSAGIATSPPKTVATRSNSSQELGDTNVTLLPDNKYVVSWVSSIEDGENETGDLYVQLYSAAGSKIGNPQKVNPSTISNSTPADQHILPDGSGGYLIAYTHEKITSEQWIPDEFTPGGGSYVREYESELLIRSYSANGLPNSTPQLLYSLNTSYPNATYYSLIKTTDGFLATWVASAQTGEIFGRTLIAQKFDSSFNEIGDEIIVVPVAQPNANDASLTQLADGSYLAVWSTFVGYGEANATYAQRLNADLSANGEKITICETSSASYEAVATALPDGGFIITWSSGDADSFGDAGSSLFSQRYDAQGNPVGNARPLIEGGEFDDSLTWTDSEDVTLIGGNGDDILSGNTGNDLLDGGNGNDIAHYSGNSGNYTLSLNDDGELTVSANNQTDTLRNIEQLRFTDITLSIGDGTLAIENSEAIGSETPKVATLKDGSQVIVWVGENGLNLERYKGYERLNSESIQDLVGAENPSITALEDGFIITWESFSTDGLGGFSSSLLSQRFASDLTPLEAPITIHSSDGDVYFSEPNAIALTTGGYALAWCEEKSIWTDSNSNGWMDDGEVEGTAKVYVQLTDTEGQAGTPILVSSSKDAIWAFEPSITALPGGGFAVVWEHEDDSTDAEEIFLQRFDASGNKLGGAIQVNTSKSGDQGDPDITTLTDGSIVVTWSRETHNSDDAISSSNIFMQRFSASGTKLGTETKVNAIDGIYGDPAITALTGGGYVVTWATSDEASSSGRTLYAQVFDKSGVKVGSEIVAAQSQTNMVPDIAPTADGGFLITWDSIAQDDFGYAPNGDIFAKRFDANGNSLTLTGDDSDNTLNWSGTNGVTLAGGAGDDSLTGGDASDSLVGGTGNDTLNGGKGADMLIGGEGDDIYVVDNAKDVIIETDADDSDMVKSSVSWTLGANLEDLELTGSAAINGTGNELANVLIGNNAINTLTGGDGDDTLDGKGGADKLIGGKGNDTYIVDLTTTGTLQDTITELATTATYDGGVDTVVLRGTYDNAKAVALTVAPNTENLDASDTGASKLNLNGSAASNTLTGNAADNILDGQAGADTMKGGAGNDTYIIDNIDDEVIENTDEGNKDLVKVAIATVGGSYILSANVEEGMLTNTVAFRLEGNDLDNTLTGNAAANTLIGGAGNDILDGKAGADSMSGGLGDDIYFVDNTGDSVSEVDGDGTDEVRSTISFNLNDKGTDVENLTLIGSGAINATGNNLDNILTGNLAANILDGGLGADTMKGGKGNDTYIVGEGDSVIEEFTNAQGGGIDTVKSSITYTLGANLDHLTLTGSGDINATGNDLANTLTGNDGANQLDGGAGVDKLIGGKGDDTYTVDLTATGTLQDTITELADKPATTTVPAYVGGVDTVIVRGNYASDPSSTALAKTISVIANTENLDISLTGASKLNLNGSAASNTLTGNAADNILDGKAGADTMKGGAGNDTYIIDNIDDEVIENTDEGNKDLVKVAIATVGGSYILSANVEEGMLTNTVAFRLEGNDLDNTLTGNAAANTLIGGAGNDILDGKAGADSMSGGLGDDIYFVDNTGDSVSEVDGDGTDEVRSTISFNLNDKGTDVENLTLIGSGAINATGNNLDNILTGNLAANILDGGLGADTMKGGKGNDTYIVGEGDSVIEEFTNAQGGGIDTVKSSITYTLGANLDHLTLTGSGDINATGNDLANTLTGNDGANQLDGGAGVDKLIGGKGDDTYTVDLTATGTLQDTITELADKPATTTVPAYVGGVDTVIVRGNYASDPSSTALAKTISVIANTENLDISLTGASKLNLNGSAANNILIGNDANNIIIGGAGADTMTGGAGADTFRFASLNDLGLGDGKQDVITDFISGQDKLDFKALAGWKLVAEGSVNGTKQLWTESYSVETDSGTETGLILKGNSTGDLTADFSIKLVGVTTLESTDLILV